MPPDLAYITDAAKELRAAKRDPLRAALAVAWAKGSDPHPRDFPLFRSNFYGSSLNFDYEIRTFHPTAVVPEHAAVPLMGPQPGWNPLRETPPPGNEPCEWCQGRPTEDAPAPGDETVVVVCPKCQCSAFDHRLSRQRAIAGTPPPEPKHAPLLPDRRRKQAGKQSGPRAKGELKGGLEAA